MAIALTTIAILKGKTYLDLTVTDFDAALTTLIEEMQDQFISYCDGADIDWEDPPAEIERACAMQCTYEWKRRGDLGLTSRTFPDGTINKVEAGEFIQPVRAILNRYRVVSV